MSNQPLHNSLRYFLKNNFFDNINSFKDFEKKVSSIKSSSPKKADKLKGDALEVFVEGLINNLDVFEANKVYPSLKQTPALIRNKLNITKIPKDKGVDGVFINKQNKIVAYQVKFRTNNEKTSYEGISKFNNQGKLADIRYLIDNSKKTNDEYFNYDRKNNLTFNKKDFDNLNVSEIKKIISWLKRKPLKAQKKATPDPTYQVKIINDVVQEFKTKDRATMLMACGSGKTLVSMWIAQRMKTKTTVVFAPSLALIKQIHDEWQREGFLSNCYKIFICSSLGDTSEYDEQVVTQKDVPFKVTTDYKMVRNFFKKSFRGKKIIFCSYQSSRVLKKAMQKSDVIDLGIFDEAHRTTQYKKIIDKKKNNFQINWSLGLFDKNIKIKKRLFMTATSKVTKRNQYLKDGDDKIIYVMNDNRIYGNQVCNFTFVKAREIGAISPYTVIISVITKKDLSKFDLKKSGVLINGEIVNSQQVALQLAVKQAIKKYNCKKIFTFHNKRKRAKSFTETNKAEGIKTHIKNFETFYIDGSMPMTERKDILELFETYENSIISNARCLVEGVNIPSVDLVSFVQPKNSPTDIAQAAGRAMRLRNVEGKEMGYILVPLFLEKYSGEKVMSATKSTQFEKVIKVLRALGEYDEELRDEISMKIIKNLRKGNNTIGKRSSLNNKRRPTMSIISESTQLSNKIDVEILKQYKNNITWETYIAMLLDYAERKPINPIPRNTGKQFLGLGKWINKIIYKKRMGFLTSNRIIELEKIGIKWILEDEEIFENEYKDYFSVVDSSKDHGLSASTLEHILDRFGIKTKIGYGITGNSQLMKRQFALKSEYNNFIKKFNIITYNDAQKILKNRDFLDAKNFAKLVKTDWTKFLRRLRLNKELVVPKFCYLKEGFDENNQFPYGMIFHKNQIDEYKKNLGINFLEIPQGYVSLMGAIEMGLDRQNLSNRNNKYKQKFFINEDALSLHKKGGEVTKIYKIEKINKLLKLKGLTLSRFEIDKRGLITPDELKKKISDNFGLKTAYHKWIEDKIIIPVGGGYQKNSKKIILYYEKNEIEEIKKRLIKRFIKEKKIIKKDKVYFNQFNINKENLYQDTQVAKILKLKGKDNREILNRVRILRKSHNMYSSGKLIIGENLSSPSFLTHINQINLIKNLYGFYTENTKGFIKTSYDLSNTFESLSNYSQKIRNGNLKSYGFLYEKGRIVFLLKYIDIYKIIEKEFTQFPRRKVNLLIKLQNLKKKFKIK